MTWRNLLASFTIHIAVFGTVAVIGLPHLAPEQDSGSVPIYFEVVEAAALDAAEPETGSIPNETSGSVPIKQSNAGAVPNGVSESVPMREDALYHESGEDDGKKEDVDGWQVGQTSQNDALEPESVGEIEGMEIGGMEEEEEAGYESLSEQSESMEMAQEERASVVSDPIALNRIVPVYPRSARRKGHEGSTTVEIAVADDGTVSHAEVVVSSGYAELDVAVLGAVRTARFAPATEDGVSVSGRLRLTFDFKLK